MRDASELPDANGPPDKEELPPPPEISRKTIVLVFAAMAALFALTGAMTGWYHRTQLARAQEFYARGAQLSEKNNSSGALRAYQNALAIVGGNAEYRLAVARELMKVGKPDEAAIYFQELLRADPASAEPNLMLGRIFASKGQIERAVGYYHRAIFGYWPQSSEQKRIAAEWELVDLLQKTGARKQVLAELLQLEQLTSDIQDRKRIAATLLTYGAPGQASEIYSAILRENSRDADAWAGLGDAEMMRGRYLDAQAAFRKALQRNPGNEGTRGKLELATAVVNLDPTLRRLTAAERLNRSRVLLETTLSALDHCIAGRGISVPQSEQQAVESARKAVNTIRRPANADAVESNISLAERIWGLRTGLCGSSGAGNDALARVLARLSE